MYSSHHPILQYELTHPSSLCSPFLLYHFVPCHSIPRAISPLACPKQISNRSQTLPHPLCLASTRLAFQSLLFPCHVGSGIEYDCDCVGWKGKSEYWGRWLEGTARDWVWSVSSSWSRKSSKRGADFLPDSLQHGHVGSAHRCFACGRQESSCDVKVREGPSTPKARWFHQFDDRYLIC